MVHCINCRRRDIDIHPTYHLCHHCHKHLPKTQCIYCQKYIYILNKYKGMDKQMCDKCREDYNLYGEPSV